MARRGPGSTVVVGVDGTPGALNAVAWAANEAVLRGQPLRIVHACRGVRPGADADRILDAARQRALAAVPEADVRVIVEVGDPLVLLARESVTASLLVLGPPRPGGVTRRILESAGDLAAGTLAPLVVVSEPAPPRHPDPSVAVLVDSSSSGIMAMAAAMAAAAQRQIRLRVVRVPAPEETVAESRRMLDALLDRARLAYPQVDVDARILAGRPVEVLASLSAEAALVVVGARELGRASALALGPVRRSLLGRARCPVMIVPTRIADGAPAQRRDHALI